MRSLIFQSYVFLVGAGVGYGLLRTPRPQLFLRSWDYTLQWLQWQWPTKQIITEVDIYNDSNDTIAEVATLTVASTADTMTPGEIITGASSGATGIVILGAANTTTVTYTETGTIKFSSENVVGGTSGFTKVSSGANTPHGRWQWQGSNTGAFSGEETNIGAEWNLHNTGSLGSSAANYHKLWTELSANTTGYKYYRMQGVSGSMTATTWWKEIYFKTQDGTNSVPTYDTYCNSSYFVDTTAGTFTAKLPANPAINDYVDFADQTSNFATNKLTVGRNGKNIQTLAEDLEINVANSSTRLTYTGTANGWVLS